MFQDLLEPGNKAKQMYIANLGPVESSYYGLAIGSSNVIPNYSRILTTIFFVNTHDFSAIYSLLQKIFWKLSYFANLNRSFFYHSRHLWRKHFLVFSVFFSKELLCYFVITLFNYSFVSYFYSPIGNSDGNGAGAGAGGGGGGAGGQTDTSAEVQENTNEHVTGEFFV